MHPDFDATLAAHSLPGLGRVRVDTLQVNVGKRCNQACHHCHVEAGPKRTERMVAPVVTRVLELLAASRAVATLDVTGGAPELNPHFRRLVTEARRLGCAVVDRCNLTILFEPGQEDLAEFLAAHGVAVVASLPCYTADTVERQRGQGVFAKSVRGLRDLNALGYGRPGTGLRLDLVYNPVGAFLPPPQAELEARYRDELGRAFGITFDRLLTITNMPIKRFAEMLAREGAAEAYASLLVNHFNPATVEGLMCRALVSVGWDGRLYDCDFNQMLELPLAGGRGGAPRSIWEIRELDALRGLPVATARHCFACTAGAGSSCGGALA
jgi:radical SAM/Cys-rich protein